MTAYHCPECGQPAEKPPWLVAREAGFDPSRHCGLWANLAGKLVACYHRQRGPAAPGYGERQGWMACDLVYRCPHALHWREYAIVGTGTSRRVVERRKQAQYRKMCACLSPVSGPRPFAWHYDEGGRRGVEFGTAVACDECDRPVEE